jgi:hypothetical protein
MNCEIDSAARILEIEARQDDALRQLAELELRIEQVLAEFLPPAQKSPFGPSSPPVPATR